jgi:methylthioribulose 1-phosphate dehydratase / enolase-phosphatase E1
MLGETIRKYPKTYAVLVRRHGMYVWGKSWQEAKRHGECLHYLFEIVIKMSQMGLDYTRGPILASESVSVTAPAKKVYKHVIFDIEGTTTPISFVKDVLFPYASDNVKSFLETSWSNPQTVDDVKELIHQYENDVLSTGYTGPHVDKAADKAKLIADLVNYVKWNIAEDRKISALKQIQGHIWEIGYIEGKLKSHIFGDVPKSFESLSARGSKISIYSSGSRVAQLLLFKYSNHGDLRKHINVYFDTKVGHKRETSSYHEICQYLGADNHSEVLFVTDIYEEATAAAAAGLNVLISVRDGNGALPEECSFTKIHDFSSL